MRKPELLAPGGSFAAAVHALEAGADGVYLGLKELSARRAASNFTLEQLRRIRGLAADLGRKLYVALNTVVRDAELALAAESLAWAEALGIDAVIVQDLGVAELARRLFPSVNLHASTQMAVHNEAGARLMAELGFRRVILSRELTLAEIERLRAACPNVELEVFVHGALCYSLSGACLASWALTGRSGNRGACAQVCRSRFSAREAGGPGPGRRAELYCFSCRDLFAGQEVTDLARVGIDALKIEGRMKSPEYAVAVVRLYRKIIDEAAAGRAPAPGEYDRLVRETELAFSREKTSGWLRSSSGVRLVNTGFPGHRGARLGEVELTIPARGRRPAAMRLRLEAATSVRDGVAYAVDSREEPVAFSVQGLRAGGRSVKLARSGETVEIDLPEGPGPAPAPGTEVRHLSSRSLDLPAPREGAYPAWRMPVEVAVEVRGRVGAGSLGLRAVGAATAEIEQEVTLVEAREPRAFAGIVTPVLGESGTSLFRASASSVTNRSDLADDRIFVPPSELKRARSRLYEALDADFLRRVAERSAAASRGPTPMPHLEAWPAAGPAPDRASLSPRGRGPIPFARRCGSRIETAGLARCDGAIVVPLPTFMPDAAVWSEAVSALASERPGERLLVGIGNVAHAAIARALDGRPNVSFFIDFHLYVANRWTVSLLARLVRPLAFAFSWIEGDERDRKALEAAVGPGLLPVGPGFRAPLFYSRGCYAKHVLFGGRCPADCAKEFAAELRQGQATFEVQVRDCMTYVFGDAGAPGDSAGGHSDSSGSS